MADKPLSISIQTHLTRNDLYRFTVRMMLRKFWFLAVPIALISVLYLAAFLPQVSPDQKAKIIANLETFPYFAGVFLLVIFVVPYFSAKSQHKSSRFLQGSITYTFSEEGLGIQTSVSTSMSQWAAILRAEETKSFLMLYPNKVVGMLIPKRDIPEEATLGQLRKMIRENVKGKVKLRGPRSA